MKCNVASSTLLTLLPAVLATACFGGGHGVSRDAGIEDADLSIHDHPIDIDGAMVPVEPGSLPEGGELRLERIQLGPDDTSAELAAQALFFADQDPAARSYDGAALELRAALADDGYVCSDFRAGDNFDNGNAPQAQAVADSRAYFDVGATVTLTNADDLPDVITLDRFLASADPAAAIDRSSGLVHDILYKAPESALVRRNTRYLPTIAGSPMYPELELTFGEAATGEDLADSNGAGTAQIFMPSAFTLSSPAEADFYGASALVFTRGQDFTITYEPDAPAPASWPTIVPFIGFVNDAGTVEAYCFKLTRGQQEDGRFTVPHEVLAIVTPDAGGHVVFGRMVHTAWTEARKLTRLDLIGIESKVSPGFVIQDATAATE